MASGGEKSDDFYAVLGLKKECTAAELRNAYKKLALRWHPDRCSASGNSKFVEEAKKKFQAIQQAYSVLSDENKRFLYDVGAYDSDDDGDATGMGGFLNEMAAMMSQTKPSQENGEESFGKLQELFEEMFQGDIEEFEESNIRATVNSFSNFSSYSSSNNESSNSNSNKRNSSQMNSGRVNGECSSDFSGHFQSFCFGAAHHQNVRAKGARGVPGREGNSSSSSGRRSGRKQKLSSAYDVSSNDYSGISAA